MRQLTFLSLSLTGLFHFRLTPPHQHLLPYFFHLSDCFPFADFYFTFLSYLCNLSDACVYAYLRVCVCACAGADWQGSTVRSRDHLCILSSRCVWVVSPQKTHSAHIWDIHTTVHEYPQGRSTYAQAHTHMHTHTQLIFFEWVILIGQSTGAELNS